MTQSTDEKAPETFKDWLAEGDCPPELVSVSKDGSVQCQIQYAYKPPEKGDDPEAGPKVVKFRPMYGKDFRDLSDDTGQLVLYTLILRLTGMDEEFLGRMNYADFDNLRTIAQGIILKKFLPTP